MEMKVFRFLKTSIVCSVLMLVFIMFMFTSRMAEGGKLTAVQILHKCDDFHFVDKDAYYKIKATLIDKNGSRSYQVFEMFQKGLNRIMRWLAPPDIAGFSVLTRSVDTIYVYEPSLNKVRRIASHARKQTMLGNDFTLDEAASFRLGREYNPKLIGESDNRYILYLTQKEGRDKAWPILRVYVDKKDFHAAKIEYCDGKDKVHKTETRYNVKKMGGHFIATTMKMVDHDKKHTTIYNFLEVKFNLGLPDSMFSKRNLVRSQ